jgi:hypothetical protein
LFTVSNIYINEKHSKNSPDFLVGQKAWLDSKRKSDEFIETDTTFSFVDPSTNKKNPKLVIPPRVSVDSKSKKPKS